MARASAIDPFDLPLSMRVRMRWVILPLFESCVIEAGCFFRRTFGVRSVLLRKVDCFKVDGDAVAP